MTTQTIELPGLELLNETDWLAGRRTTLGASEASAVLGVDDYEDPIRVWMRKTGQADGKEANQHMTVASMAEPIIAYLYGEQVSEAKLAFEPPAGMRARWRHPLYEWMSATPDRLFWRGEDLWLAEFKHPKVENRWKYARGLPESNLVQVLHQYLVLTGNKINIAGVSVAAWFGADDLLVHDLPREAIEEDLLVKILRSEIGFWKHVQTKTRPGVISHAAIEAMPLLYPKEEAGRTTELPPDLVSEWLRHKAAKEDAEKQEKEAAARIMAIMESSEVGTVNGARAVSWRQRSKAAYQVKASTYRQFEAVRGWRTSGLM